MYKIRKYKWEDRNKHYFSSDWHIFHDPKWEVPIWKSRGYSSAQEAAEKTLLKINERVGENDTLWYLGDGFLNATDDKCLEWLARINCKDIKYLNGNHESNVYRLYKEEVLNQYNLTDVEVYPLRMGNIEFIGNHVEFYIGKRCIILNHFPLHSWHSMGGSKSWMISGHQHNTDPTRNPDAPINRVLDVGWDWKRDVWSFDEVEDVMSVKTFVAYDHHKQDHF